MMVAKSARLTPITQPRLLIVEGDDEVNFFQSFLDYLGIDDVQIQALGGIRQFRTKFKAVVSARGFSEVQSLAVVRDADKNAQAAFQSIRSVLQTNGLSPSNSPGVSGNTLPKVTIHIIPNNQDDGMLENLCLESVADDPAMSCVHDFIGCISGKFDNIPHEEAKATVRTYLTSWGLSEEYYFETISHHMSTLTEDALEEIYHSPSLQVNLFLASRYKPSLRLGEAARKRYWPFDHSAFRSIGDLLKSF